MWHEPEGDLQEGSWGWNAGPGPHIRQGVDPSHIKSSAGTADAGPAQWSQPCKSPVNRRHHLAVSRFVGTETVRSQISVG